MPVNRRAIIRFTLIFSIFASVSLSVSSSTLPDWYLTKRPSSNVEYLNYKLAYSGFITAFVWTELANVAFQSTPNQPNFYTLSNCSLSMKVSSEQYGLAETLRATRMHWRSILNSNVTQLYYSEKIDLDGRTEHEVTWIDWNKNLIDYYTTPEKEDVYIDELDDEFEEYLEISETEKSLIKDILPLTHQPDKHRKATQLSAVHSNSLPELKQLLDPLSLLYIARWNDYSKQTLLSYNVAYKDEVRQYRIEYLGKESMELYGEQIQTIKVESKRWNEDEAEEEGYITIWLTDDNQRIPVMYLIEAVVGEIRVKINKESLKKNTNKTTCKVLP